MSHKEMITFTTKIINEFEAEAIIAPFCGQFLESNLINKNVQLIETAMNIIKAIITSRSKSNQNNNQASIANKLESLPSELIGEVSSYLEHKDHISLSKANRSIYIGCNSPNTLQVLDLIEINDHSCIKLTKYPLLKHLKINLLQFDELSFPTNNKILHDLNQLTLGGHEQDDIDIDVFSSQTAIDFSKITHLIFDDFGDHGFLFSSFQTIISLFPNIEYLSFNDSFFNIPMNEQIDVKQLFPNLEGYCNWSYGNYPFSNTIISTFGSTLKSLHLICDSNEIVIPSNISFTNLEELYLCEATNDFTEKIINTTKSLKRVKLQDMKDNDHKELMKKIFNSQSKLNEVHLSDTSNSDNFKTIIDALEYGLCELKDKHRMRVHVICGQDTDFEKRNASEMFIQTDRLRDKLTTSIGLDNFSVRVKLHGTLSGNLKKERDLYHQRHGAYLRISVDKENTHTTLTVGSNNCGVSTLANWLIPDI